MDDLFRGEGRGGKGMDGFTLSTLLGLLESLYRLGVHNSGEGENNNSLKY